MLHRQPAGTMRRSLGSVSRRTRGGVPGRCLDLMGFWDCRGIAA